MLEILTKSKIRRKIFLLFIYNQNKEYYLSEIAKIVGTTPGTAQRELNKLIGNDLITFKKKAGINLYALNKRQPLLPEIQSIIKKTFGVESELRDRLSEIKGISYAFLFGSYARGGFRADSDIDLFVIGDTDEEKVFRSVREVERNIGRDINYHIFSAKEFSKKLKISSFLKEISKKYILLIGDEDGFRRIIKTAG